MWMWEVDPTPDWGLVGAMASLNFLGLVIYRFVVARLGRKTGQKRRPVRTWTPQTSTLKTLMISAIARGTATPILIYKAFGGIGGYISGRAGPAVQLLGRYLGHDALRPGAVSVPSWRSPFIGEKGITLPTWFDAGGDIGGIYHPATVVWGLAGGAKRHYFNSALFWLLASSIIRSGRL